MTRWRPVRADPLLIAVLFEAALIPLALLLAVPLGLEPWHAFRVSPAMVVAGVIGTVPLIAALTVSARVAAGWFEEIHALVRPLIESVFRGRGVLAVIAVSALAGVGEELLFRGVIQSGLSASYGAWPGLLVASVLFGVVHALSRAYFVLATVMGLYLGTLYQVTGNLLLPAIVHGLYDALAIGYLLLASGEGSDEPSGSGS